MSITAWINSELEYAKKAFARAERDKCWADTAALGGRISALHDVLSRLDGSIST